jgi:hypothetical protein
MLYFEKKAKKAAAKAKREEMGAAAPAPRPVTPAAPPANTQGFYSGFNPYGDVSEPTYWWKSPRWRKTANRQSSPL